MVKSSTALPPRVLPLHLDAGVHVARDDLAVDGRAQRELLRDRVGAAARKRRAFCLRALAARPWPCCSCPAAASKSFCEPACASKSSFWRL